MKEQLQGLLRLSNAYLSDDTNQIIHIYIYMEFYVYMVKFTMNSLAILEMLFRSKHTIAWHYHGDFSSIIEPTLLIYSTLEDVTFISTWFRIVFVYLTWTIPWPRNRACRIHGLNVNQKHEFEAKTSWDRGTVNSFRKSDVVISNTAATTKSGFPQF